MNIDFHVHGLLSKKINFDSTQLLESIEYAKLNNLHAFVLCEHYNAKDFLTLHQYLFDNYEYKNDRYIVNNFSIFPGMEVSIKNKGHIIVVSSRNNLLSLYNEILPDIQKDSPIDFETLLNLADKYECLKIGSHPFRKGHKLIKHPEDLLKRLDAFDLNAKDIFKSGFSEVANQMYLLSKKTNVPIITGSDSHYPIQLGSIITTLNYPCYTIKEIKDCLSASTYSISISPTLDLKVYTAKVMKHHLLST